MEWWHDITLFPVCQQENPKKAFPYNQNTICTEPGAAQNAAYKRKILFEFHRGSEKNLKFPIKKPDVRRASDCRPPDRPPAPANSALRPTPPHVCGQALRYACAWLRASWLSAISGASRPSASLGGGLRTAVALRAVLVLGAAHP